MEAPAAARGIVIVATGAAKYIDLAARAAASVRRAAPGLAIDLFTDAPRDLPVFDRIHLLEDPWFRSKIDGLLGSRFERTLYMDADMLALADFSDIFDVLDRFDIALVQDWFRNSPLHHTFWRRELPPAFPQFNGGLIAIRRNAATTAFLKDWKAAVQATDTGRDQISLRELLWESDLRIATLPEEYNLLLISDIGRWTTDFPAPRIIHSPNFHRDYERYAKAADPAGAHRGQQSTDRELGEASVGAEVAACHRGGGEAPVEIPGDGRGREQEEHQRSQCRRGRPRSPATPAQCPALGPREHPQDHQRQEQVELLLDRERPVVLQGRRGLELGAVGAALGYEVPVHELGEGPGDVASEAAQLLGVPDPCRTHGQHEREREPGGGKQPAEAAPEEATQADGAGASPFLDQQGGDQEPRQGEERRHPEETPGCP